jgi:hypothetical protein
LSVNKKAGKVNFPADNDSYINPDQPFSATLRRISALVTAALIFS